jgi:hypothetical protein
MITVQTLSLAQLKTLAASRKVVRYHLVNEDGDVVVAAGFDQPNETLFVFTVSAPASPFSPVGDTWFDDSTVVSGIS